MGKIKLSLRHKKFAELYAESGNGTESYKQAYKTCNDNTARANASKLLANPNITAYINQLVEEADNKQIAKAEEVLQYLTGVMRGEIKDAFGLDPSLQERNKAAEMLGRRYGLFTDKVENTGANGGPIKTESSVVVYLPEQKHDDNDT